MLEAKSILEMASGAILEQSNIEFKKIIDNILDPNTDPKKKRTLQITVDFTPSQERDRIDIDVTAKSKLQPYNSVRTTVCVGVDSATGEVQAVEMVPQIPGQMNFDGTTQEEPKILKIAGGKN